ncbi:DUF2877 domain-containing protein [Senegalia massiliensis]|uniref:DUF2877 domain-containing protein n=1 Tax=Senegalia massiliensis TaxID=1720316 RepID=UPI00102FBC85|nr:DUF2877 domain-containing protein [Senegalia massiliensis]
MSTNKIKGLYLDRDFQYFLKEKNIQGDIHSIFDKVVNIQSDNGTLYTISNNKTDNAPYTLKVDYNGSFKDIVFEDQNIIKNKDNLFIGNIEIDLSSAELWNVEREKIQSFSTEYIKKNIGIFNMMIQSMGSSGGCKYYYLKNFLGIENNSDSLIERELSKKIDDFYMKIKQDNIQETDIRGLIGLGMGLTPSGDDFLTGFMAAITIFNKNNDLFHKIKDLIPLDTKSTTDVSRAMLKAATQEKFREYLNDFIYSFLYNNSDKYLKSFKNLLTIGSSSGTDMSIGVVLGFLFTIDENEMEEF